MVYASRLMRPLLSLGRIRMALDIETIFIVMGAVFMWVRCCIALVQAFLMPDAERYRYVVAGGWVFSFVTLLVVCLMVADFASSRMAAVCLLVVCVASFVGLGLATRRLLDREMGELVVDIASARDWCARAARVYDLTRREEEVLAFLLEGQSISQISGQLFVSTNTVKTHVRNLYRKLGVSCRQDLAVRVVAAGEGLPSCPGLKLGSEL